MRLALEAAIERVGIAIPVNTRGPVKHEQPWTVVRGAGVASTPR